MSHCLATLRFSQRFSLIVSFGTRLGCNKKVYLCCVLADHWAGSLDVDPEMGKLYVSNHVGKTINEMNLNGSESRTLIDCPKNPRGIAIDLNNRFVC